MGLLTEDWGGLAARWSKANKQAKLVERQICLISDPGNCGCGWEGDRHVSKGHPAPHPLPPQAGVRASIDWGVLHAETAEPSLTISSSLISGTLISIILAGYS